ncbi:Origin recognition complex subunit 2 [Rhizophlyctis rosea]|uniref:Origin recognition complex subunit 2 n=1 Tax=Rhizophlyctis rosea TaxID=64517 RepID=A0AAD5WXZ9_9FUNG|nr:Origin recognition complex subunit 2 [Rhizophlyctis rosea]
MDSGALPDTPSSRARKRRVQTGLTLNPQPKRSSALATASASEDDFNEDRETIDVLRATPQKAGGDDKENGTGGGVLTPGKEIYGFEKKGRKSGLLRSELSGVAVVEEEASGVEEEGGESGMELPNTPTSRRRGRTSMTGAVEPVGSVTPSNGRGKRPIVMDKGKTPDRGNSTGKTAVTPSSRVAQLKRTLDEAASTPQSVRAKKRRVSKRLATVMVEEDGSEEDGEDEEADDEDEEEEEDEDEDAKNEPTTPEDPFTESAPYERYFENLHTTRTTKTSNNTLSKLPPFTKPAFDLALSKTHPKHIPELTRLKTLHTCQFPQWKFELSQGFNLLFYGFGSKRSLLNSFAEFCLSSHPVITVNGYHPTCSISQILRTIIDGLLNHTGPYGSIQDQTSLIQTYFTSPDRQIPQLYILIHNIDGANLRSEKTQTALATLAETPNIYLVGSVDHIGSSLMWDAGLAGRFGWCWHDVTTFENYKEETSFENGVLGIVGSTAGGGVQGVVTVLRSLNANARRIFRVLAEWQVESEDGGNGERGGGGAGGLSYDAFYTMASERFLVSNDVNFRTQLTEFRDHKIIMWGKGADKGDLLSIPYEKGLVEQVLEVMKEKGL